MTKIMRAFVNVNGRPVHYRRAGNGPPVVMMHGSPGDSQMLLGEIAACAENFTVFALDTAGFGYSQALPGEELTVVDLAAAAAETMRALKLPPCPVYGTHTGACIAIELANGWPDQVSAVLLEGLPAFTQAEMDEIFTNYFAAMIPDPLGGHLVSTFIRFRDQFTWFPWPSRNVKRLNAIDRPEPADIDLWVSMFYRSCKTYKPAYRAACFYGQAALRAAAALTHRAIYFTTEEDMLFSHLDRLPPVKPSQRIERQPLGSPDRVPNIKKFLLELAADVEAPAHRQDIANNRLLVDGPHGQIFVRVYGDPAAPAMALLHDAPGTSLSVQETAQKLAETHRVFAPDAPGTGQTDPAENPLLAAAENILAAADALGIDKFEVTAFGSASAVAAKLSGARVSKISWQNQRPLDPAQIAPEIPLSPTGAHWVAAWLMLRDCEIYDPWYDGKIAAQRSTQGNFDAAWRHDETVAFMEGRATYHLYARAAAAAT
jgi:pimeloyl-ACP methyl ester carboxylesterase